MADPYFDPAYAAAYDANHPGLDGDIGFYAGLALEAAAKGQAVLELGAGNGRVAIPVARRGVRVTGLERSPAMLAIARQRSAGIEGLTWVEGDMGDFHLGTRFGLVMVPYRSFLHLMTAQSQEGCLRCAREHLLPDGRLALNFFSPDVALLAARMSAGNATPRPSNGGRGARSDHGSGLAMRYVKREEFEGMLGATGLEVEALHGWFDGSAYGPSSTEMVWLARPV